MIEQAAISLTRVVALDSMNTITKKAKNCGFVDTKRITLTVNGMTEFLQLRFTVKDMKKDMTTTRIKDNVLPMLAESTVHSRKITIAVVSLDKHGVPQVLLKAFKRMVVRNTVTNISEPAVLQFLDIKRKRKTKVDNALLMHAENTVHLREMKIAAEWLVQHGVHQASLKAFKRTVVRDTVRELLEPAVHQSQDTVMTRKRKVASVLLTLAESTVHSKKTMIAVVPLDQHGVPLASSKAFKRMVVRNTVIDTSEPAALQSKNLPTEKLDIKKRSKIMVDILHFLSMEVKMARVILGVQANITLEKMEDSQWK
jgi:hypothetical protein